MPLFFYLHFLLPLSHSILILFSFAMWLLNPWLQPQQVSNGMEWICCILILECQMSVAQGHKLHHLGYQKLHLLILTLLTDNIYLSNKQNQETNVGTHLATFYVIRFRIITMQCTINVHLKAVKRNWWMVKWKLLLHSCWVKFLTHSWFMNKLILGIWDKVVDFSGKTNTENSVKPHSEYHFSTKDSVWKMKAAITKYRQATQFFAALDNFRSVNSLSWTPLIVQYQTLLYILM